MPAKRQSTTSLSEQTRDTRPRCGLCGKTRRLTRTECCDQWVCDDEDRYVLFSYAQNSCSRNHRRYTLCGSHYAEQHRGKWQSCKACRSSFETEMYVYYGTNDYNFEKLVDVPTYKPTRCARCDAIIKLAEDYHVETTDGCFCGLCYRDLEASRRQR